MCQYIVPCWPFREKQGLKSPSVMVRNTSYLKYRITRLESLNRKFAPILIITEGKNDNFLACKQTGLVDHGLSQRFCKNDSDSRPESLMLTRVESFCEKRDSSPVAIVPNVTCVESDSTKIVTRVTLPLHTQ